MSLFFAELRKLLHLFSIGHALCQLWLDIDLD